MRKSSRGFDWAATPLGPIGAWPVSLKSSIGLILRSPVPIVTLWGEDGIMIYNDGYSGFAGGRHPNSFGSKVREGWPEVADFNDNIMKVGLAGKTLAYRDFPLTLYRHGGGPEPEQVWLNLDYSPLHGGRRTTRRRHGDCGRDHGQGADRAGARGGAQEPQAHV